MRPCLKRKWGEEGAEGVAQTIEHEASKCKVLNSNASTTKKNYCGGSHLQSQLLRGLQQLKFPSNSFPKRVTWDTNVILQDSDQKRRPSGLLNGTEATPL